MAVPPEHWRLSEFSLQGHFLLSMPQLNGSYFGQSLILMCEHNADGALGIIVNKSTKVPLTDMLDELEIPSPQPLIAQELKVLEGGPVAQDRGFVLHSHTLEESDCLQLAPALYLSGATAALSELVNAQTKGEFLVMLGYAGWGAGQLEEEIKDNAWLTVEASSEVVFASVNDTKLERAAAQLGIDYRLLADAGHA